MIGGFLDIACLLFNILFPYTSFYLHVSLEILSQNLLVCVNLYVGTILILHVCTLSEMAKMMSHLSCINPDAIRKVCQGI